MWQISIKDVENIRIGQAENLSAGTGCTVVICDRGAPTGLDIRGGGPATRETGLLSPLASADKIHAIVLSGGSAFGLDAAGGVMRYLEERHIGFDVGVTKVPLVCQSSLFDLTVGDCAVRPDAHMAYAACVASEKGNYRDGNYGAGTGATVGKYRGMSYCMKSGIGSHAVQIGELKVGALVAVNALGDVYDWKTGKMVAGMLNGEKIGFRPTVEDMYAGYTVIENKFTGNTTIGIVMTNACFDKSRLCKIAGMAQNGVARSIHPVHTSADGDSVYAMSVGTVQADMDMVGTLAADVMSEAILSAVKNAETAYGYISVNDFLTEY